MKILVIGENGQLGKSIKKLATNTKHLHDFVFVNRKELDLSDEESIFRYFNYKKFCIIVNCAAYTQVDKAEEEKELANQINHLAVSHIAQIAKNHQSKLIHISTDYVFDGKSDKPYLETDEPNPLNIYGKTKLAGEKAIQKQMPRNGVIIRTSWVYSEYGNNFVTNMLSLGNRLDQISVVSDQVGSPTYANDLGKVILQIINNKEFWDKNPQTEIYNYSNKDEISWYDFAYEIFKIGKIDCKLKKIRTEEYKTSAKRPKNTIMDKTKIYRRFGIKDKPMSLRFIDNM